jgi:glycosyltransferase involved in cell wall biosynthesis
MADVLPLTLLVIARNEAAHIARCLNSVPFAAEKLVVDSGSTDGTQALATQCGARVIEQPWLGFGPQRNFASTQATHDWILVLDADEELTPALSSELSRELPGLQNSNAAGGILRREAWYMGAPMRWYRPMVGEALGRLYHRKRARWTDVRVHESLRFDARTVQFRAPFRHHHNPTLVHKHLKMLMYAELKLLDRLERNRNPQMWLTPFVGLAAFFKDYVLRLAFLDGWRGYIVARVAASYAVYKRMRYYEMLRNGESVELARRQLRRHLLDS